MNLSYVGLVTFLTTCVIGIVAGVATNDENLSITFGILLTGWVLWMGVSLFFHLAGSSPLIIGILLAVGVIAALIKK